MDYADIGTFKTGETMKKKVLQKDLSVRGVELMEIPQRRGRIGAEQLISVLLRCSRVASRLRSCYCGIEQKGLIVGRPHNRGAE
jgi:hypothetical protein